MYRYKALIDRVVDGDTIDMMVDLGFDVWTHQRIRLHGIDAPEKNTPLGKELKKQMANQLEGKSIVLDVTKPDKYGRYLGTLWLTESSSTSINEQLCVNKLAKSYSGNSKTSLWASEELSRTSLSVVFE